MVTTLEEFKKNAESLIEDAVAYDEPIILKTGMGNMFLISEAEYMNMAAPESDLEQTLFNMK